MARPFHAAIAVDGLAEARAFYGEVLGCREGRSADDWVDFDLFGNQLVCHLRRAAEGVDKATSTVAVDGKSVPVPHWGVVLDMRGWAALADRLRAAGVRFVIEPHIRFEGQPGEQGTLFITDPSGNALEFKGFARPEQLFEK